MLDGFSADLLSNLGAGGLLAVVVWMILTGRLVPRRTLEDMAKEREYWRSAFFSQQQQSEALMETGRVAQEVLKALPIPHQGKADEA